jgi:hypothetical protein
VLAPAWTQEIDRVLARAMREAPMLASATPVAGATREELAVAFARGEARAPRWTYAPSDGARAAALARALESLAAMLEGREGALGAAYAERARELAIEVLLASEAGAPCFAERALLRFAPDGEAADASRVAREWISAPEDEAPRDHSSDAGEGSLAARLREEIGRRRLPFRVVVSTTLAPLAATGDRMIWVAAGRALSAVDVERTVLHEIDGHAAPRARAMELAPALFALGTARGVDDQEGLALCLEERHGFLVGARRRELALRHRAIEAMDAGATFVDAVRTLVTRDGATWPRAVAAAERAFRGSDGEGPGLGRERVYLAAFVRVARRLAARPDHERVLASGQVAVGAIEALRPYCS